MGGICGIVNMDGSPVPPALLVDIAEAAAHRGPDGLHHRIAEGVAFSHLALNATPESENEHQPLQSSDGAVWVVADLRLDNRAELIGRLRSEGFLPEDAPPPGDAGLVLASYLYWGERCVKHLFGDFAFAIWDGRQRRFLCARDPLGIKPLCYARSGSRLLFASEAQQILRDPSISRDLDELTLADHLAGWPQTPEQTFFRAIRRLPSAHQLIAWPGGETLERYWTPQGPANSTRLRGEDVGAALADLFERAVTDRLRASGEAIGVTLSGGLDSSSVAAVAQHTLSHSTGAQRLLGCSFVFEHLTECDERDLLRILSDELDFEVSWIDAENRWLLDDPNLYIPALESPFMGWQSCHQQVLSLMRSHKGRVLLTGQGGDDLLRGSRLTLLDRLLHGDLRVLSEIWSHGRNYHQGRWKLLYRLIARPLLPPGLESTLRRWANRPLPSQIPEWIAPSFARRTGLEERLAARVLNRRSGSRAWRDLCHGLVDLAFYERIVHWYDRNAAPFGIEVRHPFLDRRLVDFVLSLPPEQLFELGWYKPLLRRAMAGRLPDPVRLRRKKTNLGSYVDFSLREKAVHQIEELFRAPLVAELGLVDGKKIREIYASYRSGEVDDAKRLLWFPITLELWLRRYIGLFEAEQFRGACNESARLMQTFVRKERG